jgi:hypothetical protein
MHGRHVNRQKLRDEIEQSGIGTPPQKLVEKVAPERRVTRRASPLETK